MPPTTFLKFHNRHDQPLPEKFRSDDVRYSREFVRHFIEEFTEKGDVIFDPFMGFGTTLLEAEAAGRIGYGVEFDKSRCEYVRSIIGHPERAVHGDSTKLQEIDLPDFDFSITSPPYMGRHHTENPFTAYSTIGSGYESYLSDLRKIYEQIESKLKSSGHVVVEVSNLKHEDGTITTLAWDIAAEISKVLKFQGETIIIWDGGYAYGYDHSYALLFSKPD